MSTLAGIAAENRYLARTPPLADPLVALSDLAEWQERALQVLGNPARVRLVGLNVMRKLQEWLEDDGIWRVVERLAARLLAGKTVQGPELQLILSPLNAPRMAGQRA